MKSDGRGPKDEAPAELARAGSAAFGAPNSGSAASGERLVHHQASHRLILQLDSGGMAEVHLALASGLAGVERLVVTKRLRPEFRDEEEYIAMFLEEARLAARLSHPNIVHTYEVGHDEGIWFIAMEFLEGQSLARLRKRARLHGGIPLVLHFKILSDALAGLEYAHELADFNGRPLELVHRDVNPQNIFIGYDGQVKLLDFGIAKAISSDVETRPGFLKGKLCYMAPEQVCGGTVDRRADLFSVGAMMWEAVTGRRLWGGAEEITIFRRLLQGDLPWLTPVTGVPSTLASIYEQALASRPDDRFSSAAKMQLAIDAYLGPSDDQWSKRDLGRYVSDLFVEEREGLRRMIADELAREPARPSGVPVYSYGPASDRAPSVTIAKPSPPSPPDWAESEEITCLGPSPSSEKTQPKPNPALAITTPSSGVGARTAHFGPVARAVLAALVAAGILAASAAVAKRRGVLWGHSGRASATAATTAAQAIGVAPSKAPPVARLLPAEEPAVPSSDEAAPAGEDVIVDAPVPAPATGIGPASRVAPEKRASPRTTPDAIESDDARRKRLGRRPLDPTDPWNR